MNTLTGKPLFAAFAELNKQLEANAYKEITGGKGGKLGLTDIKPAYLPEQLLELFGPFGWGWGFDLLEMNTAERQVKRSAGYEETEYVTTCKIGVWYRFETDGTIHKSDHMIGTGGSDNTQIEWAEKGALTSAIGTAWFFAGYQLDVYKGLRSHKNTGNNPPQAPKSAPQTPAIPEADKDYMQRVKTALRAIYGDDIQGGLNKVEELTTFTNKEGKEVKGTRDLAKITGKRLEILAHNLEKLVPKKEQPPFPDLCPGCGKDHPKSAPCEAERLPGEEG